MMSKVLTATALPDISLDRLTSAKARIATLARQSLQLTKRIGGVDWRSIPDGDVSLVLTPQAVLALEGDSDALSAFVTHLLELSRLQWGLREFGTGSGLNDSFAMRAVVEAYHGLINAGLVGQRQQEEIAAWLYELAAIRVDGRIQNIPNFAGWQIRNQGVPASMVYEIAHLLDVTQPASFDTAPLWIWADKYRVDWETNWRTPDDSWLYQFIWVWSAYRHAVLRCPELLRSPNARRSVDFYKKLSVPGGIYLIFGETRPMDLLGPLVAITLGSRLFHDGELLWIAQELLERQECYTDHFMLSHRAAEFYRLYTLWPGEVPAVRPQRRSCLITSPLAGRGWSTGNTPYNESIKRSDTRFPAFGRDDFDWDDLYQVREPALYATGKPDKLVFSESPDLNGMFALVDLRAQGLHDHPDALNVATLISQGIPWLVESGYVPQSENRIRWLHNVPLYRRGAHDAVGLKTWRSDTWREVEPGDVMMHRNGGHVLAAARLRHDAYDYVCLDGDVFDVERVFFLVPDKLFLIVDRLTAAHEGEVTVGQMWHTTAEITVEGSAATLRRGNNRLPALFLHSIPMQCDLGEHNSIERDQLYFVGPVRDLLWHSTLHVTIGQTITLAAAFGSAASSTDMHELVAGCLARVDCLWSAKP